MRSYFRVGRRVSGYGFKEVLTEVATLDEADTVGSRVRGSMSGPHSRHLPCIDIDMECELVPSETHGHYHLYINKVVPWRRYKKLLKAMRKAGIIGRDYYWMSWRRKQTLCRVPASPPNKGSQQTAAEIQEAQDKLIAIEQELTSAA